MKSALSSYPQGNCRDNQGNFLSCFKSEIRVGRIDVLLQRDTGSLASSPPGAAIPVLPERNQGVGVSPIIWRERKATWRVVWGIFWFFCPPSFLISPILNISAAKSLIHSCGERKIITSQNSTKALGRLPG